MRLEKSWCAKYGEKMLETIIKISQESCNKILEVYNTDFSFESKDDNSPLTLADTASNEIIVNGLKENYPDIPILSEEGQKDVPKNAEYCWVFDPLDGTKEFISRNGQFTVNIALIQNQRPILGVIAVPVTGVVFFASKGNGAFKQENGITTAIHVSDKKSDLIWVGSKSHSSEKEENLIRQKSHLIKTTIQAGSSLKGTMVAEGKADVYYRFGLTCEWDTCAMHCIAEEAGGIFRQMDGTEMLYNRDEPLNKKGFFIVNCEENVWSI